MNIENERFYKVPNELVWKIHKNENGKKDNNQSLIAKSNQRELVLIHCAIMEQLNVSNRVCTTIGLICDIIGLPKTTRNVSMIRNCLFILTTIDMDEVKVNDSIMFDYLPFEQVDGCDVQYFIITYSIIDILSEESSTNTEMCHLLNVYSYISARIFRNKDNRVYDATNRFEVCFPTYDEICSSLAMGKSSVSSTMKKLRDIGLIYWANIGKIKSDNGDIINTRNTITLTSIMNYEDQVRQSMKFYRARLNGESD